jgi:hypothetical protein
MVAIAVVLIAAFAVPAMALEFTTSGYYRIRGLSNSHPLLVKEMDWDYSKLTAAQVIANDALLNATTAAVLAAGGNNLMVRNAVIPMNQAVKQQDASDSWWTMRFQMDNTLKVNDNLSVSTRFRALDDRVWGEQGTGAPQGGGNEAVTWKRAWMGITTPFGKFDIGRMSALAWGTTFADTEDERDRIKYTLPLDADKKITLLAIIQKDQELEAGAQTTDSDTNTYYLAVNYKTEPILGGLLGAYTSGKANSDAVNPVTLGAADLSTYALVPYIKVNHGEIRFQGELYYRWGDYEWDKNQFKAGNQAPAMGGLAWDAVNQVWRDYDIDAMAWNAELGYDSSEYNVGGEIGYAWASGDAVSTDNELNSIGGVGWDWDKLWILTSTDQGIEGVLGGATNLAGDGATNPLIYTLQNGLFVGPAVHGSKIFYLGAYIKPMEDIKLGVTYGNAKAEQTPTGWSSEYGSEYDFKAEWTIFENLTWTFIAAYLDAGDYWKAGNTNIKLENNLSLFNELKVDF